MRNMITAGIVACAMALTGCSQSGDAPDEGRMIAQEQAQVAALEGDAELVERGERLFSSCSVCHSIDSDVPSPAGPHLEFVVGRGVGGVEDYPYTPALTGSADLWTVDNLGNFLRNPQEAYPGTAMAFAGIEDDAERQAVIAYLATLTGSDE